MTDSVALLRQTLPMVLPRLRRFARTLTHHAHDADDLAQIAIERALRARRNGARRRRARRRSRSKAP